MSAYSWDIESFGAYTYGSSVEYFGANLRWLVRVGAYFYAVSTVGVIRSSDGGTWTLDYTPPSGWVPISLATDGLYTVALLANGTSRKIAVLSGGAWSADLSITPSGVGVNVEVADGVIFVWEGGTNTVYFSDDGWSTSDSAAVPFTEGAGYNFMFIHSDGTRWYFVGSVTNGIVSSADLSSFSRLRDGPVMDDGKIRAYHATVSGGGVTMIGGRLATDDGGSTWATVPAMSVSGEYPSAAIFDGVNIVASGYTFVDFPAMTVQAYDAGTNTWSLLLSGSPATPSSEQPPSGPGFVYGPEPMFYWQQSYAKRESGTWVFYDRGLPVDEGRIEIEWNPTSGILLLADDSAALRSVDLGGIPIVEDTATSAGTVGMVLEASMSTEAESSSGASGSMSLAYEYELPAQHVEAAVAASVLAGQQILPATLSGSASAGSTLAGEALFAAMHVGNANVSSTVSASPVFLAVLYGLISGSALLRRDGSPVDTWVVSEGTGAVSRYIGYDFSSFGSVGGVQYGMAEDGVYVLGEDSDEDVSWSVDFGSQWLNDTRLTRLSHAYMGVSSSGAIYVRVSVGEQEYTYEARAVDPVRQTQRFDFGLGLRAACYELVAVGEGDAEVSSVEFVAVPLTRRI